MLGAVRSTKIPTNSSAPASGAVPFGLVSPSISVVRPTAAPADSMIVGVAAGMCRSVLLTKGGAVVVAMDALSFVPPAERVLV